MFIRHILFCLFLMVLPLFPQGGIDLSEAWQIALKNNLTLQQQQKQIRKALEEWRIQKSGYLPSIAASAGYNYVSELAVLELSLPVPGISEIQAGVKNQYDIAISLQQPIFTGFRTKNLIKAARQQHQAQQWQQEVVKNQLLFRIGQLFYEIHLNRNRQQVLREAIHRIDNHLELVRNLYQAGQAPAFDTLEVANRKLQTENQLLQLRNMERVLLTQFRHLLNSNEAVTVKPLPPEAVNISLASLDEYLGRAQQHRPELQQVMNLREGQQYRRKALQSAYFPQVFAAASYHYARPGVNFFRDEWMDYYTVGVNMQWQLWNWKRDRRKVEQAQLDYQRLELQNRQLLLDIRQQVVEAYELLKNDREQIALQKRLVHQERERYRIVQEQFSQGQASNTDLRNAETSLTQAELLLRQTYIQWRQHKLQLDWATGIIGKE